MYEVAPTHVHDARCWVDQKAVKVAARLSASRRGLKGLVGRRWARQVATGEGDGPASPLLKYPILEKLGLDKAHLLVVSGSPLGENERRFVRSLGLPVVPACAPTEAGGIVTLAEELPDGPDPIGASLPGSQFEVDPSGEIVLTGSLVGETSVATGDTGTVDGGEVRLEGRRGERLELASGDRFPMSIPEVSMRLSRYVREAVVAVVDGRVVVTVEPAAESVERWATERDIAFAPTFRALATPPEVGELLRNEVAPLAADAGLDRVDELRVVPVPLEEVQARRSWCAT